MTTTSVPPTLTGGETTPTDSTDLPRGARRFPDAGTPASALDTAHAQLAGAVDFLGYDDGLHEMLATPRREVNVAVPLRRDDGRTVLFHGYRVQHNVSRGPGKGGLRSGSYTHLTLPTN